MRAALDDSRIPMMELLVAHGADVNAAWGGHYPVILGPCETYAPRALKWLLDRGADLHAAAKYSNPVGMPGDSTMLHGPCPVAYLLGVTQFGVHPEDRTAGPAPWTTCPASAA
jgi:hypothetical protein